jgi:uncharacterized membrane protein (DUF485 family)
MTTALAGGFFLKHSQIKTGYLNCIVHLTFCRSTKKGGKMRQSTFLALLLVSLWTSLIAFALYSFDAHLHYRELSWAIPIGLVLIITHMVNMTIYFKVRGNKPYSWDKYKKRHDSLEEFSERKKI